MHLRVPVALVVIVLTAPATASAAFSHVVEPGESLSSVAASDGLSVEQLAAANGLSAEAPLIAGSTLAIPPQQAAGEAPSPAAGAASSQAVGESTQQGGEAEASASSQTSVPSFEHGAAYVVQPGDTLSQIAARAGTSVEGLAALNGIEPQATLLSGAVLTLPSEGVAGAGEGASSPAEATEAPPYPTAETVSPEEVGAIATEHGVPPSLAEAVAEQESGFDNALTSSANARGVMQIIPETWSFINQDLAGSTLEPASATANVQGGVLLLRWLLAETEGDPAQAAAGYYQGLDSVRQEGDYPETEQYVSSVLALQGRFAGE